MRKQTVETPRPVYFKREDFEIYGYSPGCDGCRRLKAGLTGYKHPTPECRRRMETAMSEDRHPKFERALTRRLEVEENVHFPRMPGGSGQTESQRKRGREEADQAYQEQVRQEVPQVASPRMAGTDVSQDLGAPLSVAGAGATEIPRESIASKRAASKEVSVENKRVRIQEEESGEKRMASKQPGEDAKRSRQQEAQQDQ